MEFENWEQAFKSGYSIVVRANRLSGEGEDDIVLGRLAAKALLVGVSEDWIYNMLSIECEHDIEKMINRRLH